MADDKAQMTKDEVTSSLSNLTINTKETKKAPIKSTKKAKKVVADSWDDDSVSSASDEEPLQAPLSTTTTTTSTSSSSKAPIPSAPPPTPSSPGTSSSPQDWSRGSSAAATPERRPEKTDAVARRMIAAGLGLKAPKRTEEQREYEKSIREQEKRRREVERAAEVKRKEDVEKAKAAMWDD